MNERIIIFGDSSLFMSGVLLKATLGFTQGREDIQVVAVCDSGRHKPNHPLYSKFSQLSAAGLIRLFEPDSQDFLKNPAFSNFHDVARQFRVKVVVPPDRDINHPEFVQHLREELRPSIGLSFGCLQIFGKELLRVFDQAVNYHNGLLPEYGGLCATRWSIYHGEPQSGFTFHFMNERIDEGHILIQGAVPLELNASPFEVEYRKTLKAADHIENMIKMLKKHDLGQPQKGTFNYFGRKEFQDITTIHRPYACTSAELQRRLRCFQVLYFPIDGRMYAVTTIKEVDGAQPRREKLCFVTDDQRLMKRKRQLNPTGSPCRQRPWT